MENVKVEWTIKRTYSHRVASIHISSSNISSQEASTTPTAFIALLQLFGYTNKFMTNTKISIHCPANIFEQCSKLLYSLTRKSTSRSSSNIRRPKCYYRKILMSYYDKRHIVFHLPAHLSKLSGNITILALEKTPILSRKCLIVWILVGQIRIYFLRPVQNRLGGACHAVKFK